MKTILENIDAISTRKEYDLLNAHIDLLVKEATMLGYLAEPNVSNEYTRELGRMAQLCHAYEKKNIAFDFEQEVPTKRSVKSRMLDYA